MKKSLIALAVLASFAGVASAQSSVTLFGIVDATLAHGHGSTSNKTQLTNSGYNSSRLGFRGTEDLGGGMSASFWLEAGIANDNGEGVATNTNNQLTGAGAAVAGRQGLTFNRRSTVSLAGGWGELRLGRDYTPQFWNLTVFDPFGTNGVGQTLTTIGTTVAAGISGTIPTDTTGTRASNSIGYFLPGNLGGFYGQAQYYLGENASNTGTEDDGSGGGVRVGWASGPFNVAVAASKTNFLAGDVTTANIGGQWDFGFAKLMGQYNQVKLDSVAFGSPEGKGWLVGGLIPVGAGEIRLAYSTLKLEAGALEPEVEKAAIGYVHNLSKRTAVYTTYAFVKNKGGANFTLNGASNGTVLNGDSQGLDIGIRHSF
jgi:predicted porin